jgi:hypothetical protein
MVELLSNKGYLSVQGTVESEAQLQKLNDIVSSTDPPVGIHFAVTVSPEINALEEKPKREDGQDIPL